jgi:signal transduction histidine kinase
MVMCMEDRPPASDRQGVIGGVEVKVKRARLPGPGSLPAGRPAAGELEAFGLRALDAVGARLALLFLGTALAGIPLAAGQGDASQVVLAGLAVFACAAGVTVVLVRRWPKLWVAALAIAASVSTALLSVGPPVITWDRSHTLAAWVVAGLSSGVAASRGPVWGLVVFVPAVVTALGTERAHGGPVSALIFLGALTYYVGAAVTHVLARRGFATTERALQAVEAAEAAQRVAEERWQARREADRLLHDTVLATLSVLAHQGVGVAPDQIRAACARDLGILAGGDQGATDALMIGPAAGRRTDPVDSGPEPGWTVGQVIETAIMHATGLGLQARAHLGSLEPQATRLDPLVASALNEALAECVTNVRLHSGAGRLDLVASVTGGALVVLVVDQGHGFDPATVPEDRLGLRGSVHERLSALGGTVAVWSRPGQGTSVKLRLPLLEAAS